MLFKQVTTVLIDEQELMLMLKTDQPLLAHPNPNVNESLLLSYENPLQTIQRQNIVQKSLV